MIFKINTMKYFTCLMICFCAKNIFAQNYTMLVGTYDSPKSEGIYVYQFNSNNGTAKELSHIKINSPSFIDVSKNGKYVYAVNENANKNNKGGMVSSFYFNRDSSKLVFINQQSSEGNSPCHLSLDKSGKTLAVANYSTGNFSLFNINKNGSIDSAKQTIQHYGNGTDSTRQKSPHVHSVYFSKEGTKLFVADLGTDKVSIYDVINKTKYIEPKGVFILKSENGYGPRHIAFNKQETNMYVLEEMKGNISVYTKDLKKYFQKTQSISTLSDTSKAAGSAEILLSTDGNFLYASNRGESNTIAIFSINKSNGSLSLIGHQSTLGLAPRNFNFDPSGNFLLVANQKSDEIVIFKVDKNTGLLTDSGNRVSVGRPVCIKWISKEN
jgi:6-phosphogluconolactonase